MGLSPWLFVPVQDIKSGQSPLMYAVERNNVDMVKFLIEVISMCMRVREGACVRVHVCVCVCDDMCDCLCTACFLESAYFCFMARTLFSAKQTTPLFPIVSLSFLSLWGLCVHAIYFVIWLRIVLKSKWTHCFSWNLNALRCIQI